MGGIVLCAGCMYREVRYLVKNMYKDCFPDILIKDERIFIEYPFLGSLKSQVVDKRPINNPIQGRCY